MSYVCMCFRTGSLPQIRSRPMRMHANLCRVLDCDWPPSTVAAGACEAHSPGFAIQTRAGLSADEGQQVSRRMWSSPRTAGITASGPEGGFRLFPSSERSTETTNRKTRKQCGKGASPPPWIPYIVPTYVPPAQYILCTKYNRARVLANRLSART